MDTLSEDITLRRGGQNDLARVFALNREIFGEEHLIQTLKHDYLLLIIAERKDILIGFKIGYRQNAGCFYSAKGGVHPAWRKKGLARLLLRYTMELVKNEGFRYFRYHTFPTRWPGMLSLGISEGFTIAETEWNPAFGDYQVLLERDLSAFVP